MTVFRLHNEMSWRDDREVWVGTDVSGSEPKIFTDNLPTSFLKQMKQFSQEKPVNRPTSESSTFIIQI
jgi:hypothetical protein